MRTEEEIRARIGELALQNWNNWHHSRKYCSTRLKEDEEIGKKIDLLEWVLNDKEGAKKKPCKKYHCPVCGSETEKKVVEEDLEEAHAEAFFEDKEG